MPLVRIDLNRSTPEFIQNVADAVHEAMVEVIGIPVDDRFQIISQHEPGELIYDSGFYGIDRTDGFIVIQIMLMAGRTTQVKQNLYKRVAELLAQRASVRQEDVFIALTAMTLEDISLGNGKAQFVENPPAHLRSL